MLGQPPIGGLPRDLASRRAFAWQVGDDEEKPPEGECWRADGANVETEREQVVLDGCSVLG